MRIYGRRPRAVVGLAVGLSILASAGFVACGVNSPTTGTRVPPSASSDGGLAQSTGQIIEASSSGETLVDAEVQWKIHKAGDTRQDIQTSPSEQTHVDAEVQAVIHKAGATSESVQKEDAALDPKGASSQVKDSIDVVIKGADGKIKQRITQN